MWDSLPLEQKEEYKSMILAFASLTEAFAQKSENDEKIAPIINSKFQESVFGKTFNATIEDIGNTSFDASLNYDGKKYLIGIKTFGVGSGKQKIAQFKANHDEWSTIINEIDNNANGLEQKEDIDKLNYELYLELATKISELRNKRINSSIANLKGFKINDEDDVNAVYHILMPSKKGTDARIYVGEVPYDRISIENIKILGCTKVKNPSNFEFTDGNHVYKYTSADSQLLMDFENVDSIKEKWEVTYAKNAYDIIKNIGSEISSTDTDSKEEITECYVWKLLGNVEKFSGFNSFYGVGSKMSKETREINILKLENEFKNEIENSKLKEIISLLEYFLLEPSRNDTDREKKVAIRNDLMKICNSTSNEKLVNKVSKMVFRPKNEMYIPIPNAKKFHLEHPDFFADGVGSFENGSSKLSLPKNNRRFNLVFEPSKDSVQAYITQDNGKAIESCERQTYLGEWILRGIFQLEENEPLTDQKLLDMNINSIKLYKVNNSDDVHLEFIWHEFDEEEND